MRADERRDLPSAALCALVAQASTAAAVDIDLASKLLRHKLIHDDHILRERADFFRWLLPHASG